MDKGTSESSLLGAGSPLPSIPLHSIVSYCTVPDQIHLLSERKVAAYIYYSFRIWIGIPRFPSLRIDCLYLTTWWSRERNC